MNVERLLSQRAGAVTDSGIRRVFDLGVSLKNPINLSIGQPSFPVPDAIKRAAADAITGNRNGYTVTQGIAPLRERLVAHLAADVGWTIDGRATSVLVTAGTSGALVLAFLALLGPGDEAIVPDPYFVAYPHMATLCGGRAVRCDTYPDFALTAERVEPLITPRTKFVLLNSPSNPCGTVSTAAQCRDLLDLCRRRNVLLISDEIYDLFVYSECRTERAPSGAMRCPSPARLPGAAEDVLLIRGFGKSYGVTGWRLGYVAGPRALIESMARVQQYTFVCAPAPLQWGAAAALDVDMSREIDAYQRHRDEVVRRLGPLTGMLSPGGAFYAFCPVPPALGLTGSALMERCVARELLVVPGRAFSDRDTHFRLSFATDSATLGRGLDVLAELLGA